MSRKFLMVVRELSSQQMSRMVEGLKDYNATLDLIPVGSNGEYTLYADMPSEDAAQTVLKTRKFLYGWCKPLKIEYDSNPRDFW
ncbi:hypothetical protein [Brevibacillus sp. NRS-1366]|uniref:hypothetical protein n=1 Tax=Brevibacillus sp. NRS-1366 TaxID=3233899 RepID=UPI003D22FFCD